MAKDACPAGAPLWMVTFADLMALLLTLFVLLLTFAEMDVIKYKQLAGSLRDAFGAVQQDRLAGMIELDGALRRKAAKDVVPRQAPVPYVTVEIPGPPDDFKAPEATAPAKGPTEAELLAAKIKEAIAEEIAASGMTVEQVGDEVVIQFPSSIAFPSGSAILTPGFSDTLAKLHTLLVETEGDIVVAGHTDNVPLTGGVYRSNWELSAARATSVVHELLDRGQVRGDRVSVQGYGDSRPVAPNDTPENRARNRRVEVSIHVPKRPTGDAPAEAPAETPTETPAEAPAGE